MKTSIKRIFSLVMAVAMVASLSCVMTSAQSYSPCSSDYLDSYCAGVTPKSGGRIVVSVTVCALGYMTEIGAHSVTIFESSDQRTWNSVATYYYDDDPSLMTSGWSCNFDVLTYYGTPGLYYRAAVYCYAGNENGYDMRLYTTSGKRAIN